MTQEQNQKYTCKNQITQQVDLEQQPPVSSIDENLQG
jgi:hypothetical protein